MNFHQTAPLNSTKPNVTRKHNCCAVWIQVSGSHARSLMGDYRPVPSLPLRHNARLLSQHLPLALRVGLDFPGQSAQLAGCQRQGPNSCFTVICLGQQSGTRTERSFRYAPPERTSLGSRSSGDLRQSSHSKQIVGCVDQVGMRPQPVLSPQRVWCRPPTVFIQPNAFSMCDVD